MSRLLTACALLLALLGAGLAAWLIGLGPDLAVEAAPEAAVASGHQPDGGPLRSADADVDGARRESDPSAALDASAGSAPGPATTELALEVAVLDLEDRPVPGARVRLQQRDGGEAETDALGLAALSIPADAQRVTLRVDAEGFVHALERAWVEPRVEVRLLRATRARGRVVERTSEAGVAGAALSVSDGHDGCEPLRTSSASDGSFELAEVPIGARFEVAARAPGFADGDADFQLLEGEGAQGLLVELERSAGVRLRVVDFHGERPIAGARLRSLPDAPRTDERGEVDASRLIGESARSTWVRLTAPGYCRLDREVRRSEWEATGVATVALVRGVRFEGVVRDDGGQPIAGARVQLDERGRGRGRQGREALPDLPDWRREWTLGPEARDAVETDAEGRFATPGVPPSSSGWRLRVEAEGFESANMDPGRAGPPGQSTWIEIALAPSHLGVISGRLTLNGEPVAGQVTWRGPSRNGRGGADAEGRFRLERVEPGAVVLGAQPRARGRGSFGSLLGEIRVPVELPADGEVEQDIALELPLATLTGRVITTRAEGVAGVEVIATIRDARASFRTTTLSDGRFELELPDLPRPWLLQARGRWSSEPVSALAGARDVELVIAELGRLRVRIVDSDANRPLREFEVVGRAPGEARARTLAVTWRSPSDPAGWVQLDAPSGPLELVVSPLDREYPPAKATVGVPPGGAAPVRVDLSTRRGHTLTLALAEGSARPTRRAPVFLLDEEAAAALPTGSSGNVQELSRAIADFRRLRDRRISFDGRGRARLRGLSDGLYRLVDFSGGAFEPSTVALPRDAGATVEVRWRQGP